MPRLSRIPHCASAYHLQICHCQHSRMLHQDEQGVCRERGCDCVIFTLQPGYPELEHRTIR